jgi:two-component sensor histidine kinase
VDGAIVARAGRPSLARATAVAAYRPAVNPVEPRDGELDILFRTSNWDYRGGGIWKPLSLGDRAALAADQQASIYLAIALTVTMLALSLNSLIIFVNRRKEKSFFFFALFGFIIAARPLVTGEYALVRIFPGISFDLLVRFEYATAMFAIPSAVAFFLSLFPDERARKWTVPLMLPFSPFLFFEFFLPLYWLTWSIFVFYGVALSMIILACFTVLARAFYRKTQGGLAMFIGGCLVAATGINDILYSAHIIDTGYFLPFALALFVFLQSFVLATRFTSAFDRVETLSRELSDSNALLKAEIQKAMAMSARLEESLTEKEALLKEVHHRVRNSLQIISSLVSLQVKRSTEARVEGLSMSINNRIRAITLANEKLFEVDTGDTFDLSDYARDILRLAISSCEDFECRIEGRVEGERIDAESTVGIDFGLIVTELITNSLKHAILTRKEGSVVVSMREERGILHFDVVDDGPGFPEGFEPQTAQSLGFRIVQSSLQRREGSLSISRGSGARVSCSMRLSSVDHV